MATTSHKRRLWWQDDDDASDVATIEQPTLPAMSSNDETRNFWKRLAAQAHADCEELEARPGRSLSSFNTTEISAQI